MPIDSLSVETEYITEIVVRERKKKNCHDKIGLKSTCLLLDGAINRLQNIYFYYNSLSVKILSHKF